MINLIKKLYIAYVRSRNQLDLLAGSLEHLGKVHHLALLTVEFSVSISILVLELKGPSIILALGIGDVKNIGLVTKTTKIALITLLGVLILAELFVAWRIRERNQATGLKKFLDAFAMTGPLALAHRSRTILSQLVARDHSWDTSAKDKRLEAFANLVATAFELEAFPLATSRHAYLTKVGLFVQSLARVSDQLFCCHIDFPIDCPLDARITLHDIKTAGAITTILPVTQRFADLYKVGVVDALSATSEDICLVADADHFIICTATSVGQSQNDITAVGSMALRHLALLCGLHKGQKLMFPAADRVRRRALEALGAKPVGHTRAQRQVYELEIDDRIWNAVTYCRSIRSNVLR